MLPDSTGDVINSFAGGGMWDAMIFTMDLAAVESSRSGANHLYTMLTKGLFLNGPMNHILRSNICGG